jgi:OOP family OmpA-OmpF porin
MRYRRLTILAILVVVMGTMTVWAQEDVKGSHDHPLVTRMPGYYIDSYAVEEFGAFAPTVIGGKEVSWEGKKYSISYSQKEGTPQISMLQITRNYEQALKAAGATILGGDERRLAAELRKGGAMTGIYIEAYNEGNTYSLTIVESQPMRQDVVVDAAAMGKDITATGKVIIYGIYFDTGSAVIKPESEPSLVQMVKLLQSRSTLKMYVIGHTDNVGTLELNLKLSADRADAVVKALVGRGIAANRLKAAGVASYCPVASNASEQARAQNRRVELVEQ